jgi:hypothetical protein
MQQRDVNDLKQISSFKRVVEPGIRERVMEIQNEHATWVEFEKALLAEYMLEDASRMTRHTLMSWIEKKGRICVRLEYMSNSTRSITDFQVLINEFSMEIKSYYS